MGIGEDVGLNRGENVGSSGVNALRAAWQLPAANYVTSRVSPAIVSPSMDAVTEANKTGIRERNAYPGVKYTKSIEVSKGTFPFKFTIIAGLQAGMSIGETLVPVGDVLVDDGTYGILSWLSPPTSGSFTVTVQVEDQIGFTDTVTWTIACGTANFLFLDPFGGDDALGTGLIDAPFKTTAAFHNDVYAEAGLVGAGKCVYIREGATPTACNIVGMADATNNFRVVDYKTPTTWLGYPGESPVIEFDTGHFVIDQQADFYVGDIEVRHSAVDYALAQYQFRVLGTSPRFTMTGTNNTSYNAGTVGSSLNYAIVYASSLINDALCITRNTFTGSQGTMLQSFEAQNSVIEANVWNNADVTGNFDGSNSGIIYVKDQPLNVTVRRNAIYNNVTGFTTAYGVMALGNQGGSESVEISYNKFKTTDNSGRAAALVQRTGTGMDALNHHIFRNNLDASWNIDTPDAGTRTNQLHENNILHSADSLAAVPLESGVTNTDNLDLGVYLDANLDLTDRITNLGTHGAEVAS